MVACCGLKKILKDCIELKCFVFLIVIMNSAASFISCILTVVLLALHLVSLPAPSPSQHLFSPQGLLFEAKTRLGSTPPSCHNKCNGCHPCMASQVPSMPIKGSPDYLRRLKPTGLFDPTPAENRYSNYKPLGWKCRCGNHFFNP